MNVLAAFFGGTPILERLIKVALGLFPSGSIAALLAACPTPLVGGMIALVTVHLGRRVVELRGS